LPAELAAALGDEDLAHRVLGNFDDYRALAARDQRNIERLTAEMRARLVIEVPYLDQEVHDLVGLMRINEYLFAAGPKERTAIAAAG
jgi:hypothetical protein